MEANETLALACAHHLVETQLKPDLLNDPEDTQHGGSDSLEQYYRALCSLDGARWQRAQALKDQLKKIQEVSDTYALKQRIDRLRSELTELRAGAASRAECGLAVQENIEWTATLLDKTQGIYRSRLEYLRVFGALKRQERLLKQKEEVSCWVFCPNPATSA